MCDIDVPPNPFMMDREFYFFVFQAFKFFQVLFFVLDKFLA